MDTSYDDDDQQHQETENASGHRGQRSPLHFSRARDSKPSYHVRYPSTSSVSSSGSLNAPPPPSSFFSAAVGGGVPGGDGGHGDHNHSFSNMETPLVGHTQKKAYGSHHSSHGYHPYPPQDLSASAHQHPPYRSITLDRCVSGDDEEEDGDADDGDGARGNRGCGDKSFDENDEDRALMLGEEEDGDEDFGKSDGEEDDDDNRSVDTSYSSATAASIMTMTTTATNFRDNLMLPFTDESGSRSSIVRGLTALLVVGAALGLVLKPRTDNATGSSDDDLGRNPWHPWYPYVSSVIGYCYFVLWSVCFYPQVLLNYRRKSTKGLSNDFAVLNLMGWTYYSLYLSEMFWDGNIKMLYQVRFKDDASTVASNDVAFALHATVLSAVYLVQIAYYSDSKWTAVFRLKPQTWGFVALMLVPTFVTPVLILCEVLDRSTWLDYLYVLSYFKIFCTLTKYTKQALLNYHRQSTKGWNIWYNFLECTGGSLSMLQIVLDSASRGSWSGIAGNLAKFGLGLATLLFDVRTTAVNGFVRLQCNPLTNRPPFYYCCPARRECSLRSTTSCTPTRTGRTPMLALLPSWPTLTDPATASKSCT
jgi:cystinosin